MNCKSNRIAVVTGAAGGIGAAVVSRFLNDDAYDSVACLDYDPIIEEMYFDQNQAKPFQLDVRDSDAIAKTIETLEEDGQIVSLVNNAAVSKNYTLEDLSPEEWDRVLDINLKGQYLLAREVCPRMVERNEGYVVNVSSGAGRHGSASAGIHYSASKAGIFGLTKGLAKELAPEVRVNCVVPGLIDTPLTTDSGLWTEEGLTRFKEEVPVGRLGDSDEVARVIAFLSGEGAEYMTGSIVVVDGGAELV